MIPVDFHSHTFFSDCGIHTHVEMLTRARDLGMQGLAITDHGPALKGRMPSTLFDRLFDPVEGIRLLKGMEGNLTGTPGEIDVPKRFLKYMDVVLLGIHPNIPYQLGKAAYTEMLVAAIRNNPCVDIITHPNDPMFPLDFDVLAATARDHGVVVELNNSKNLLNRTEPELTRQLIRACKQAGARMVVSSDAHALPEVGRDEAVRPLLAAENFPEELVMNSTAERAFAFVAERRKNKQ